jgi:uncharacterized RDD family membrane protein YckC
MSDARACSVCGFTNAAGAEACAECGRPFATGEARLHPGETLHDPDDLTLPDPPRALTMPESPLLRAVVYGTPESGVAPPPLRPRPVPERDGAPPMPGPRPMPVARSDADHATALRDLAERLQARKEIPVRYAGFFVRAIAFVIDGVVLSGFGVPLAAAGWFGMRAGALALGQPAPVESDETWLTMLTAAWLAMATIYFTVLHRSFGQTIGKSMLGLRVQTLDAERLGTMRSLVRALGYAVSSSFLGFGFLLVALTPRKRGWHDFLAGSCVVRLAREEAPV